MSVHVLLTTKSLVFILCQLGLDQAPGLSREIGKVPCAKINFSDFAVSQDLTNVNWTTETPDVEWLWSTSVKHLIGAGLVAILAFVVRFELPFPFGLDIYIHDTYRVVPLGIVGFWGYLQ